ncbi:MAG: ATP-binding protein [Ignavibacteriaceae bacterium]|nr:ATP-binding protein [Ignavibacteriaceae bacterium]
MTELLLRKAEKSAILKKNKVLVIYGPRRTGKTTLMNNILKNSGEKYLINTGDDVFIQEILNSRTLNKISPHLEGYSIYAIDEAHEIKNIGQALKLIVDNIPDISVVITGSSSFTIEQSTGREPLTGRKKTLTLLPFSQEELKQVYNTGELKRRLDEFLIFGSYPEVVLSNSIMDKVEVITEITGSYILKDILAFGGLRGSNKILDLLKLLAFRIGNEVSFNELSISLGIDVKTVSSYIDLLEKSFILKKITPYSANLRSEITSKNKYYFIDNGIRNGVISQFQSLKNRNDAGQLFENFIVTELIKNNENRRMFNQFYFWRTYAGQEIDIIRIENGVLFPVEIKYNSKKKVKLPNKWVENYKSEPLTVINNENYLEYLLNIT